MPPRRPARRGPRELAAAVAAVALLALPSDRAAARDRVAPAPRVHEPAQDARIAALAARLATLRGLRVKRRIGAAAVEQTALVERLGARLRAERPAEDAAAEALALARLGLLAPSADLAADYAALRSAGFARVQVAYDPDRQAMLVASGGAGGATDELALVHEVAHALQDQRFGLQTFLGLGLGLGMDRARLGADAARARQALVEGDATAQMIEWSLDRAGEPAPWSDRRGARELVRGARAAATADPAALSWVREIDAFVYADGLAFVAHLRALQPWSRVDAVYARPPLSTEHILHPDAYERYERPVVVTAAPIPALGDRAVFDDVVGELGLAIWLRHHLAVAVSAAAAEGRAPDAAAGWGGDRLVVYRLPTSASAPSRAPPSATTGRADPLAGVVAALYVVCDTEIDAVELLDAIGDALPSVAGPGAQPADESGDGAQSAVRVSYTRDRAVFRAERRGDAVIALVGAPVADADAIAARMWARWKVKRPRG